MEFSFNILRTLVKCNENKANSIDTILEIEEKINSLIVFTDENRLKQIILNFVSNAVKFTLSGLIKLSAQYFEETNTIEISVNDSGFGIKEEDYYMIFNEELKLVINQEYNKTGSGLGLSICKNLAQFLDYEIGFKSQYGKDLNFT